MRYAVRGLCLIAISILLIECAPTREKGEHILSEDMMVEIFYDIYILEGVQRSNVMTEEGERFILSESSEWIFETHGTTEEIFQESVDYYAWDPKELEAILKEVVERLNKKESELVGQPSSD